MFHPELLRPMAVGAQCVRPPESIQRKIDAAHSGTAMCERTTGKVRRETGSASGVDKGMEHVEPGGRLLSLFDEGHCVCGKSGEGLRRLVARTGCGTNAVAGEVISESAKDEVAGSRGG